MPAFPPAIYAAGLAAHVASGRRNEHAMTAGLKTIAYTDAVAALLEARRAGADEALFLDTAGHCSEATSSNLFVRARRRAADAAGLVRRAARDYPRRGARAGAALGVPTAERPFGLDDLLAADEAFLTSSLRGIAPVARSAAARSGAASRQLTRRSGGTYRGRSARNVRV